MKNLETIADELFNKIRGRFPSITVGNESAEITNKPKEARFFEFDILGWNPRPAEESIIEVAKQMQELGEI